MENNSLIINFKLLEEININISEFLFISNMYFKDEIDIPYNNIDTEKLQQQQYIKKIRDNNEDIIILRSKSIELIESTYVNTEISLNNKKATKVSKSKRFINNEVDERAIEFRNKWKGLRPGSMGSLKSCKQKLSRWMKENPEFSFDEILKAVDMYMDSGVLNDVRFLQRADYFIFKQNVNKEEQSSLSAYIEEIDSYTPDSWTTKLN